MRMYGQASRTSIHAQLVAEARNMLCLSLPGRHAVAVTKQYKMRPRVRVYDSCWAAPLCLQSTACMLVLGHPGRNSRLPTPAPEQAAQLLLYLYNQRTSN